MRTHPLRSIGTLMALTLALATSCLAGNDLTLTKNITVGPNTMTQQTMIKGERERTTMDSGAGQSVVTIRQCDLKRTLTLNDSRKTYLIQPDIEVESDSKAATSSPEETSASQSGGTVTYVSSVKDTGERKKFHGYTAKHLKMTVLAEPSAKACSKAKQKYEIDGWYIDVEGQSTCERFTPYVNDVKGCHDHVVLKQTGGVRPGLAVQETITVTTGDEPPTVISTEVTDLKEGPLSAELFNAPADYKQTKSTQDLYGAPSAPPAALLNPAVMMNPAAGPAAQAAFEMQTIEQARRLGLTSPGASPLNGALGMAAQQQGAAPVAAPQALGTKAAGKIRIGVAPPQAQVGQGNNAGADYSTPVRNAIVALMSGPAVEIAALDSHVPVQLQGEAQQKQCDFILYSSVSVKHKSGGFGKFMKMAPMMAPMVGMGGGMGGAVAAQTAGVAAEAAAMSAQQQAINQLAGFNGQIKSKDDVTVDYQLVAPGQTSPRLQNSLKGKAKSDGEDVLTPLLQEEATNVLTEVTKK
jgi:hypothetical protein